MGFNRKGVVRGRTTFECITNLVIGYVVEMEYILCIAYGNLHKIKQINKIEFPIS